MIDNVSKGIIYWFARNSVAANLLMMLLLIGGVFGIFQVQKKVFPALEFNSVVVRVPYLGAAPQEVEEGVILKIEEALENLEGIKQITSTAVEGLATVSIEAESSYDVQTLLDEIKVQVDSIPSFPENTEKPVVYRQKASQDVLWLSVYGNVSERQLKEFAKDVRDQVANLPGISDVQVLGARDYEISVEVSESDLQRYQITFNEVVRAIQSFSIDVPGGAIRTPGGDILLRASGQGYRGPDFERIPLITASDGTRVLLGEVATIRDEFVEVDGFATFDGRPAISLRVRAVGDENALEISQRVNQWLDDNATNFPPNVQASAWGDSSFYLADRLNMMLENMFFGALLVFIVLSLFLRVKVALWVIVGMVVCFFGALAMMPLEPIDVSINLLSLFAFILVLGIVVDDAIIIGEAAYSEIDKHGHSLDNVVRGAKKVAMPATFGVLTTIAAFSPMLMVTGTFGVIWQTIGSVVILCLVFSLVESKLILPAHLANTSFKRVTPEQRNRFQRIRTVFSEGIKEFIETRYRPFLELSIANRYTTLSLFFAALIVTLGLFAGGFVRFVFFPDIPSDFIEVSVDMEEGSSVAARDRAIEQVLGAMNRMNEQTISEFGEPVIKHAIAFDQGQLGASVFVELTKGEAREITDRQIQDRWRREIPEIAGIRSLEVGSGGGFGPPGDISFQLASDNLIELQNIKDEITDYLLAYTGVTEVNDSFRGGSDEIRLSMLPKAESLGLTLQQVAQQVRFGFYGAEAQRVQRDDEEVKVMVRYPLEDRTSIEHLQRMRIRVGGQTIPFDEVASIEMGKGYASIIRVDGERSVTMTVAVDKQIAEPGEVLSDLRNNALPDMLARYPSVTFELQGSSREEGEALISLAQGAVLALFAIYALMAIPLKSYSQPLIIMSVIPFGIVGAIFGHLVLGLSVSVLSLCGIIALSGVVVNDSLIMVDFVNRARREGHDLQQAILDSGAQRFRAIILTSLTTFVGLVPIMFERSLQAQVVIPMAVSLAFGILFATFITLILVPCLYLILADSKRWVSNIRATGES